MPNEKYWTNRRRRSKAKKASQLQADAADATAAAIEKKRIIDQDNKVRLEAVRASNQSPTHPSAAVVQHADIQAANARRAEVMHEANERNEKAKAERLAKEAAVADAAVAAATVAAAAATVAAAAAIIAPDAAKATDASATVATITAAATAPDATTVSIASGAKVVKTNAVAFAPAATTDAASIIATAAEAAATAAAAATIKAVVSTPAATTATVSTTTVAEAVATAAAAVTTNAVIPAPAATTATVSTATVAKTTVAEVVVAAVIIADTDSPRPSPVTKAFAEISIPPLEYNSSPDPIGAGTGLFSFSPNRSHHPGTPASLFTEALSPTHVTISKKDLLVLNIDDKEGISIGGSYDNYGNHGGMTRLTYNPDYDFYETTLHLTAGTHEYKYWNPKSNWFISPSLDTTTDAQGDVSNVITVIIPPLSTPINATIPQIQYTDTPPAVPSIPTSTAIYGPSYLNNNCAFAAIMVMLATAARNPDVRFALNVLIEIFPITSRHLIIPTILKITLEMVTLDTDPRNIAARRLEWATKVNDALDRMPITSSSSKDKGVKDLSFYANGCGLLKRSGNIQVYSNVLQAIFFIALFNKCTTDGFPTHTLDNAVLQELQDKTMALARLIMPVSTETKTCTNCGTSTSSNLQIPHSKVPSITLPEHMALILNPSVCNADSTSTTKCRCRKGLIIRSNVSRTINGPFATVALSNTITSINDTHHYMTSASLDLYASPTAAILHTDVHFLNIECIGLTGNTCNVEDSLNKSGIPFIKNIMDVMTPYAAEGNLSLLLLSIVQSFGIPFQVGASISTSCHSLSLSDGHISLDNSPTSVFDMTGISDSEEEQSQTTAAITTSHAALLLPTLLNFNEEETGQVTSPSYAASSPAPLTSLTPPSRTGPMTSSLNVPTTPPPQSITSSLSPVSPIALLVSPPPMMTLPSTPTASTPTIPVSAVSAAPSSPQPPSLPTSSSFVEVPEATASISLAPDTVVSTTTTTVTALRRSSRVSVPSTKALSANESLAPPPLPPNRGRRNSATEARSTNTAATVARSDTEKAGIAARTRSNSSKPSASS